MIGQHRCKQDFQLHSQGIIQYTVLIIPAQTAHNQETNSSQHGPFPEQSLVQTPTFSDQQTLNKVSIQIPIYNKKTF
jgi:hypothetical protein